MQQWQIGKVKVTRVVEMQVAGGTRFLLPPGDTSGGRRHRLAQTPLRRRQRQIDHEHPCADHRDANP